MNKFLLINNLGLNKILFYGATLVFCLFLHLNLAGQGEGKNTGQQKSNGIGAIAQGDWYSAIEYLEPYCQRKENDIESLRYLGEAFRYARNYEKAEQVYQKIFDADKIKNLKDLYYLATMQKQNGKYKEAAENFKYFRKKYRGEKDSKQINKKARILMEGCEMAPKWIDTIPQPLRIERLDNSINHAHIEFSPLPVEEDKMIYASLLTDEAVRVKEGDSLKFQRKFYTAEKTGGKWKSNGEWNEVPFIANGLDVGNGSFSPDGKRFYFTQCEKNWKNQMICSIYKSEKGANDEWMEAEKLAKNINSPNFTSTQPSVAIESFKNREVLYFVSNRPEGKGGLDIWYAVYNEKTKEFYDPKNAGFKINTAADEMTPFYDLATETLYFSTDGRPGLGGLDIYKAQGSKLKWEVAENIGYPTNSSADDLYYVLNTDGETGFFTSNRPGGASFSHPTCCDDIYSFEPDPDWEEKEILVVDKEDLIEQKEIVKPRSTKLVGETLPYTMLSLSKIGSDGQKIFVRNFYTKDNGSFEFKLDQLTDYEVTAKKENYLSNKIKVSVEENAPEIINRNIELNPIPKEPVIIPNIYYEFDKSVLTDTAMMEIDEKLLNLIIENPALIIQISSHTDSKGNEVYNEKLSQRRAESVVKYLRAKGVDPQRLKAKGYGESKPIAENKKSDGSDNPEGRQKNRRTEFLIIGTLDNEIIYEK